MIQGNPTCGCGAVSQLHHGDECLSIVYGDGYDEDSEYSYTGTDKFVGTMNSYNRIYAHCLQGLYSGVDMQVISDSNAMTSCFSHVAVNPHQPQ